VGVGRDAGGGGEDVVEGRRGHRHGERLTHQVGDDPGGQAGQAFRGLSRGDGDRQG